MDPKMDAGLLADLKKCALGQAAHDLKGNGGPEQVVARAEAYLAFLGGPPPAITDAQIKHMVDRFLGYRLPPDFRPDCGVKFEPEFNREHMASQGKPPMRHEPYGTNLLNADQALAMVRHMIEGMPQ